MEIVCSWKTLFHLASECGKAKMKLIAQYTPENQNSYEEACRQHEEYKVLCLEADRMIDLSME